MEDQSEFLQMEQIAAPEDQAQDVVISPDTRRPGRIPPGQKRTLRWPVLDAAGAPPIDMTKWRLELSGLVEREISLDWAGFERLPHIEVFADFHCVTRWSRLGNVWGGVPVRALAQLCGIRPEARFALAHAFDYGWTTNVPVEMLLAEDALVATHHDGRRLTAAHGGPARLIVPRLYAWKSAKWLARLEFLDHDRAGFWERNGYHMNGDPWTEQRFGS